MVGNHGKASFPKDLLQLEVETVPPLTHLPVMWQRLYGRASRDGTTGTREQKKHIKKTLATRATIYRSLRALQARNPKNVSKRVFFGGLQKSPPKRLFLRLFWDFGPGAPGDSCKWSLGSQENPHKEFQRESGRGCGRKVSGPEFSVLVSFFQAHTAHREF